MISSLRQSSVRCIHKRVVKVVKTCLEYQRRGWSVLSEHNQICSSQAVDSVLAVSNAHGLPTFVRSLARLPCARTREMERMPRVTRRMYSDISTRRMVDSCCLKQYHCCYCRS